MTADCSTTSLLGNRPQFYLNDFAQARDYMVDDQLRPSEITDPQLLKIMRTLPREECVPTAQKAIAYADVNVPIGQKRVLAQPLITARLVQASFSGSLKKTLIVGAGAGYTAAIFAHLGKNVTALESDPTLAEIGERFCQRHAPSVTWVVGNLKDGHPSNAPYDLIYFDGTVFDVPQFCDEQLSDKGAIVGMWATTHGMASGFQAYRENRSSTIFTKTFLFDGFLPPLQGLSPTSSFQF